MQDLNLLVLEGRLTKDVEITYSTEGKAIAKFSIANNQFYNKEQHTNFFNCVAFGYSAERIAQSVKGDVIRIEGHIQQDSWTDKDGNKRTGYTIKAESTDLQEKRRF